MHTQATTIQGSSSDSNINFVPPARMTTGYSIPLPTYAQYQQHQLARLRMASHHLPTQPPAQPTDCLAFRQLAQRLVVWDRLHAHRSGTEQWLPHYPRECPVGPEVLWAVFPQRVLVRRAPQPAAPVLGRPERAVVPEAPRRVSTTTEEDSAASTCSVLSPPPPPRVIVGPDGHYNRVGGSALGCRRDESLGTSNKRPIATVFECRTADGGGEDEEQLETTGGKKAKLMAITEVS